MKLNFRVGRHRFTDIYPNEENLKVFVHNGGQRWDNRISFVAENKSEFDNILKDLSDNIEYITDFGFRPQTISCRPDIYDKSSINEQRIEEMSIDDLKKYIQGGHNYLSNDHYKYFPSNIINIDYMEYPKMIQYNSNSQEIIEKKSIKRDCYLNITNEELNISDIHNYLINKNLTKIKEDIKKFNKILSFHIFIYHLTNKTKCMSITFDGHIK